MKQHLVNALITAATAGFASSASAQPVNDHCANAIPLANHSVTLWNPTGATRDVTLPCDQFPEGAIDVWYSYTTTGPESVTVSTCGGPSPYVSIGVFAGCGGALVACDSWSCNGETQSEVSFQASGTQTYYICLVGYEDVEGDGYIAINTPVVVPPPANDTCASAQNISAAGSYPYDGTGAATDGPSASCNINGRADSHDVYFRYTAPADGWVRFDTLQDANGLRPNTSLQVFDGCGGEVLACNDDVNWTGNFSGLWPGSRTCPIHVTSGTVYIVRVASIGATGGPGILRVQNVAGPISYQSPAGAIAEPGPACEDDYSADVNYGCNTRISPPDLRTTALQFCQVRKGTIHARSTPIADGTLIHDFDAYGFSLSTPQTITVTGQTQFIGIISLFKLPCGTGTAFTGQLDQYTNPECGAADFTLSWSLPAGDYYLGVGTAFRDQPVCGINDEYWFTVTSSVPCPASCAADLGVQGGVAGQDGLLDNNDFVVFIDDFFNGNPLADFGVQGGVPGHDGLFDNNDFVVFIDAFFDGCP